MSTSAGIGVSTGTSATRRGVPGDHVAAPLIPAHGTQLVEERGREQDRVPPPVAVERHGDRPARRPKRRDEAPDHRRIRQGLVAERDQGGGRAGPERVESRAERGGLALRVAGIDDLADRQAAQGRAHRVRLSAEHDDHVVEGGREHLLDGDPHQGAPVGHRQRELRPAHACRRPGREDDRRDHLTWSRRVENASEVGLEPTPGGRRAG